MKNMHPFNPRWLLTLFLVIVVFTIPGTADQGNENCSPCTQTSPPPPSPPPPSPPPPPALPPPDLPPPTPKKPSTKYCPPPPTPPTPPAPSSYIYTTNPTGNLYPIDQDFNGGSRSLVPMLPVLVSCGLLGLLAFW